MQRCSFEAKVLTTDGNAIKEKAGYVYMRHNQQYVIDMKNNSNLNCDAIVIIDGKEVGTWRLTPSESARIERPLEDDGRFTFFRKGSNEEKATNTNISKENRGLVQVKFIPESQAQFYVGPPYIIPSSWPWDNIKPIPRWPWADPYDPRRTSPYNPYSPTVAPMTIIGTNTGSPQMTCYSSSNVDSGITGITGESGQKFGQALPIDRDYAKALTISLRLVSKRARGRRKKKTGPRPLLAVGSNPVPRAVD